MKIVCAESVTCGAEAFGTLGPTRLLPDHAITRDDLREADALVVRSKTRVGPALLAGTPVRFVGTCTAGADHLEVAALTAAGVTVADAAGSNATSVAEYLAAALLQLECRGGPPRRGRTLAIVGVGHVGRRVAAKAEALGLQVLRNDPPLAEATGDPAFRPLEEILPAADIVTLHVPLTDEGRHATRHLASAAFFRRLRPGTWFINASRGEVVDEDALLDALAHGRVGAAALDVFAGEPCPRRELVARADLATPHIAGYSREGRDQGTAYIYRALCRWAACPERWHMRFEPVPQPLDASRGVADTVRQAYDIEADDQALRATLGLEDAARGAAFSRLRAAYGDRREFPAFRVAGGAPETRAVLAALGFRAG